MERYGMALARTLVDAANEIVYARVFNPGTSDVTVYKHAHIAKLLKPFFLLLI
jgi:hypothetical protein